MPDIHAIVIKIVYCVGVDNFIKLDNFFSITSPRGNKGSFDSSLAIRVLSECVLKTQIFDIISSKYSEICSIFPAFFPHSIIKFAVSKILWTSKSWKLRFFEAKAFGNTRYVKSDNEEKGSFQGFEARSDSTLMATPPWEPPNPIKTTAQPPQGRCLPVASVYRRPSRRRDHALCLAKHVMRNEKGFSLVEKLSPQGDWWGGPLNVTYVQTYSIQN